MNKIYEYLEEHAYISKNKKSNCQFELTKERAECIANKYNSLCEEKDAEIDRLNNIINELEKWLNEKICLNKNDKDYINGMTFVGVNLQMYQMFLDKLQELKGDGSNEKN